MDKEIVKFFLCSLKFSFLGLGCLGAFYCFLNIRFQLHMSISGVGFFILFFNLKDFLVLVSNNNLLKTIFLHLEFWFWFIFCVLLRMISKENYH
jgi:hypothetical protein